MNEVHIKIEIPELTQAITCLADAVDRLAAGSINQTSDTPHSRLSAPAAPASPAAQPSVAAPQPPVAPSVPSVPVAPSVPVTQDPPAAASGAPAVPVTGAPAYTLDQIAKAGASLVDAGKMEPLLSLLGRYGVQAVTQIAPEQYGAFATELRALGAQI